MAAHHLLPGETPLDLLRPEARSHPRPRGYTRRCYRRWSAAAAELAVEYCRRLPMNFGGMAVTGGVSYATLRRHYDDDPDFRSAVDAACAEFLSGLEAAAVERAVDGHKVDEKTGADGKPFDVRKYSDPLLLRMLEAQAPERYSQRQRVEQTTTVRGDLDVALSALTSESRDELRRAIRAALAKAEGGAGVGVASEG